MKLGECIPGKRVSLDKNLEYAKPDTVAIIHGVRDGLVKVELDVINLGRVTLKINPKYLTERKTFRWRDVKREFSLLKTIYQENECFKK